MTKVHDLKQHFWRHVNTDGSNGCWLWTGSIGHDGYGQVSFDYVGHLAHRLAFEFMRGNIPIGMQVLHKCDVRHCVNPAHLFLGTHLDNMLDAYQKQRTNRKHKDGLWFTPERILEIRFQFASGGATIAQLAADSKVHRRAIYALLNGETFKHVGGPLRQPARRNGVTK